MKKRRKQIAPPSYKPMATSAWKGIDGQNRTAELVRDATNLIRQLSEAKSSQGELERKGREERIRIFLSLLEVQDAFERVFANIQSKKESCTQQMNIWVGNFRTIYRLLKNLLTEQGIVPIENLGEGFDPKWHTVSEVIFDPSKPEGTIIQETQRGYVWQGQILRKSQVLAVSHQQVVPPSGEGTGPDTPNG